MDAHPGESYVYGYNTDILGALIGGVRQALNEFLQDNVFEPLDMRDAHFYLPEHKRDRLAVVLLYLTEDGLVRPKKAMLRFLQMMLNEGELNGVRLLSPTTVRLMTVNHLDQIEYPWARGAGFGLGFMVLNDLGALGAPGSIGEYGWGGAYHSVYCRSG